MQSLQKLWLAVRHAMEEGDWPTAVNLYIAIFRHNPASAEALEGIADALYYQGQLVDAEKYYHTAISHEPKDMHLRVLLARLYMRLEYDAQALNTLTYVLAQDPNHAEALLLLCDALRRLNLINDAHARAKQILLRFGYRPEFYYYLVGILRQTLEFEYLEKLQGELGHEFSPAERRLRGRLLVSYLADAHNDAGKQRLLALAQSTHKTAHPVNPIITAHKQKIHIGFVCQELRNHPVGKYFLPLLRAYRAGHMPDVQFYIYNTGDDLPDDPVYAEIRSIAGNNVRNLKSMPIELVLETVRADGIDILFDLGGHSPRAATWLFEARLAPLQMMWLGWGHTTGLPGIDYVLADQYCVPTDKRFLAEKMAVIDAPYMAIGDLPPEPDRFLAPIARNGFVTFGQPNRFDKWTPEMIARDAKIMSHLPQSRLFVFRPDAQFESIQKNILRHFAAHGIESTRIDFFANDSKNYAAAMTEVDIVLDPIAVSGGATSMDLLAHGVPVFAQAGDQLFQRFTYSFLRYAGLDQFCALDTDDFIAKVLQLCKDPQQLAYWRQFGVRDALVHSPLCDLAHYGQAWQGFLRHFLAQNAANARLA